MGRKTQTFEKINTGTNILLSQTDYNPIGQAMAKHLHSATGSAPFLQDISYKYNERGWLKRINDPALAPTTTRLFSEQLNYDSVAFAATPKFNGNITEQMFQVYNSIQFPGQQHVVYTYDPLNRLNSGISTTTLNENVTYDNLGNITALTRGGATGNYSYSDSYNANRLIGVSGLTNTNYIYDLNGNMSHDGKNNATLTYNLLNLPQTVTSTTPSTGINITYTYDAEGQKLGKVSTAGGVTTNTDYISGIQYTNGAIAFMQTEEGRAINSGGNYTYEYTLTDHLGNNRVTFDQTTGKVGEEDYYPFGLNVDRKLNAGNKYLYNKKELQDELGQYDYGARFYDPVVARWTTVDPLAEHSRRWSPYNYVVNNPIRNIDPDGMDYTNGIYENGLYGSTVSYLAGDNTPSQQGQNTPDNNTTNNVRITETYKSDKYSDRGTDYITTSRVISTQIVNVDGGIETRSIIEEVTATVDQKGNIGKTVSDVFKLETISNSYSQIGRFGVGSGDPRDVGSTATVTTLSNKSKAFNSNDALGKAVENVADFKKHNDRLSPVQVQAQYNTSKATVAGWIGTGMTVIGVVGSSISLFTPEPFSKPVTISLWGTGIAGLGTDIYSRSLGTDPQKMTLTIK